MTVRDYRELIVWQKALDLAASVYRMTNDFPREERFGLTSQIRRSAVSIPSNIAEGQGRGATADFIRFLGMARGSLRELETQIYLAAELGFLGAEDSTHAIARTTEVCRLINGLRKSLNDKL
jgi:four helix bundle protein